MIRRGRQTRHAPLVVVPASSLVLGPVAAWPRELDADELAELTFEEGLAVSVVRSPSHRCECANLEGVLSDLSGIPSHVPLDARLAWRPTREQSVPGNTIWPA